MKKALITGITGQDGSYLTEFLLGKGYEVHGIIRRSSSFNTSRIDHIFQDPHEKKRSLFLHYGDMTDTNSFEILKQHKFDEIYNLAAQSHVRISFDIPVNTSEIVALGTLKILETLRKFSPKTKFYQASSSEMFGLSSPPQSENTPMSPQSPYGCAKVFGYNIVRNYREAYKLHASNGILFNHESPRRGENFVTKKITKALSRIKEGTQEKLFLGNLDAKRDWGFAKDYVEVMWLMLQQKQPDDYIIGTGESHSVREFLEESAKSLKLNIKNNGKKGLDEKYFNNKGKVIVEIDSNYFRPSEINVLLAKPEKAKRNLNWKAKTKFRNLVKIMSEHDLVLAKEEKLIKNYEIRK